MSTEKASKKGVSIKSLSGKGKVYRFRPRQTLRYYVEDAHPDDSLGKKNIYHEVYKTKENSPLKQITISGYTDILKKLYEEDILNTHWREATKPELKKTQKLHLKSKEGISYYCYVWWEVADEKAVTSIAVGVLGELLKNKDFLSARSKGEKFILTKAENEILSRAGLIELYDGIISYSDKLLNAQDSSRKNSKSIQNPLSEFKKREADKFAKSMGTDLKRARESGSTTTRKIASYFNKNGILSALGNEWSASAVSSLIRRRRILGLESKEQIENLYNTQKSSKPEFEQAMGKHLDQVRGEGISSTRKIADRFNDMGIKTKTGKDWSNVTVHKLIKKRQEFGLE